MELKPDKAALLPCPFCGMTPDVNDPNTFQTNQGTKWGFVNCCCNGPEVRTSYKEADFWRDDAISAWNTRAVLRAEDGMREQAQRALDHYDMRSEMYTNDADLARNMATILRTALAASGEME